MFPVELAAAVADAETLGYGDASVRRIEALHTSALPFRDKIKSIRVFTAAIRVLFFSL
jgi:hypothetical protein